MIRQIYAQAIPSDATWCREPSDISRMITHMRIKTKQLQLNERISVLEIQEQIARLQQEARELALPIAQPDPLEVLRQIKEELRCGRTRKALATVYDAVDSWFEQRRYPACDEFLRKITPSEVSVDLLIGILTITAFEKKRLKRREEFFLCTQKFLQENDPSRAAQLLHGLE
jgi:hypothetical protein